MNVTMLLIGWFVLGFISACLAIIIAESIKVRRVIWKYGTCFDRHARMNVITGKVYFVLWQAGKQGHMVEYWHEFGDGHESTFKPYMKDEINYESRH